MLRRPPRDPPGHAERRRRERERQRRCRAHHKANEVRFEVYAPEHRIVEAMIISGRTSEAEALDHARIERELENLITEWADRWLAVK